VCERSGRLERADDVLQFVQRTFGGYDWPGNVRELVNAVSVASSLPPGSSVTEDLLRLERASPTVETSEFSEAKRVALDAFERRFLNFSRQRGQTSLRWLGAAVCLGNTCAVICANTGWLIDKLF